MMISCPFIALVWHIWHGPDLWRMPCPGRGTSEGKWAIESSIEGGRWHVDKGWHGHCLSSLFSCSVFNWILEIFKGTKCGTGHCPLFRWLPEHQATLKSSCWTDTVQTWKTMSLHQANAEESWQKPYKEYKDYIFCKFPANSSTHPDPNVSCGRPN